MSSRSPTTTSWLRARDSPTYSICLARASALKPFTASTRHVRSNPLKPETLP